MYFDKLFGIIINIFRIEKKSEKSKCLENFSLKTQALSTQANLRYAIVLSEGIAFFLPI